MDIIGILKFLLFFQLPILSKALIIWIFRGKKAAISYRLKCFAELSNEVNKVYNEKTRDIKTKLFKDLETLESSDPILRSEGKIRILEVGVGSGPNIPFYPKNRGCNLIGLDHNSSFQKFLQEKLEKTPNVILEDFVVQSALNMSEIQDESIDVVITTKVICSIGDINKVMKEIHRVLVPGGRFYYLEHILEKPHTFLNIIQRLITTLRIWPFFFDGCQFRHLDLLMKVKSPFTQIEQEIVYIDTSGYWIFEFNHTHVAGYQVKNPLKLRSNSLRSESDVNGRIE